MPLGLNQLSAEEQLALVALVRLAVGADGYATDDEVKQLRAMIAALGKQTYLRAAQEADERFSDEEDLWRFLTTIKRPQARELIYETVLEAVLADAPSEPETKLLDRLTAIWHIKARVVEAPR